MNEIIIFQNNNIIKQKRHKIIRITLRMLIIKTPIQIM